MRGTPRRLAARTIGAALLLLALTPVAGPAGHRAAAADRGLVVLMQTRYDPVLDERLVRVTIDAVGTSYTPNSPQGLAYYSGFKFSIPADAEAISASSGGERLSVKLGTVQADFRQVEVTFSHFVFFQESYPFRVVFQLPDIGGAPDRDVRVSSNIVAFPILAYGSPEEAGSGVKVVLPTGFRANLQGSPMATAAGPAGEVELSAANLVNPFDFFAYLAADRPGTFGEHHLATTVAGRAAQLWVRNWEGDAEWGTRMSELMSAGLPVLQEMIGLPYAVGGSLVVEEATPTRLGDYAGTFTQVTGTILVRYDADAYIGLHEAAHIWFNETLFDQRWINEGWAEFYGVEAAKAIGETGTAFSLTDQLLRSRIPLNEWGLPGVETSDTELFAYSASYHVANLIFARTDLAGLRSVWRSVANREMSYQPAHLAAGPDVGVDPHLARWQQLLDLLDQRIGRTFDDIWSEWIVNPTQQPLLDERAVARDRYAALLATAGQWDLPTDLRAAMSSWQFAQAEAEMGVAGDVLTAREKIAGRARDLGLTPPAALQAAFERGAGLHGAQHEAATELDVLAGIATAADRLDAEPSLFETIGLLGADPEANLTSARAAFEADHLDAAARDAAEVVAALSGAESAGQLRSGIAGGGLLVVAGSTFLGARMRRRRRAAAAAVQQAGSVPIDPPAQDSPA